MSVDTGLYVGKIECLVSKLVDDVRLLGVFARDELPDFMSKIRPICLILNTDPNDQPLTHWLDLYAFSAGSIKIFYLFGLSPSIYSLDVLNTLHSSFFRQSPSTSVCGNYSIVFIYICFHNYSLTDFVDLLTDISSRVL